MNPQKSLFCDGTMGVGTRPGVGVYKIRVCRVGACKVRACKVEICKAEAYKTGTYRTEAYKAGGCRVGSKLEVVVCLIAGLV